VVSNICIYAAPDRAKAVAIVIPTRGLLQALAAEHGLSGSYEQLVRNEQMKALVLKDLQNTGRKAGLAPFEIIEGIVLTDSEWTSQNVGFGFPLC
jgi:long-chain acyl-CoA synthetase